MDITEFEQNLNEKVLPLIKKQLMLAYTNGYKEAEKEWEEMTIAEHMEVYLSQGMDKKEAMKAVAADRGIGKREVYQALLD